MGLINLEPTFHEGEELLWRRPAARSLTDRTVAGMLFLTSIGVVFMPNRLNRRRYIVSVRIPHDQIESVDTLAPVLARASRRNGGLRRRLRMTTADETLLFVINHPEQVADEISSALPEWPEPA
jgi:hypothetical protein